MIMHVRCMQAVRAMAARLSQKLGLDIYVFSVFHVFFEQYLDIGSTSIRILGAPLQNQVHAWLLDAGVRLWPQPGLLRCGEEVQAARAWRSCWRGGC